VPSTGGNAKVKHKKKEKGHLCTKRKTDPQTPAEKWDHISPKKTKKTS